LDFFPFVGGFFPNKFFVVSFHSTNLCLGPSPAIKASQTIAFISQENEQQQNLFQNFNIVVLSLISG
jgi:hypothetical protein